MSESSVAIAEHEILYLLTALVDKSLVAYDESTGRYKLLETVRQYGSDRLAEMSSSDSLRLRHSDYYWARAEQAYLSRFEQELEMLNLLDTEHDNLRAALDHLSLADCAAGI